MFHALGRWLLGLLIPSEAWSMLRIWRRKDWT
jgi:hypothetical protein